MLFKSKSVNFYPLWNETEHKLRFMLKSCLNSKYGENWEQQLDSYKDSNTEIDNCKTLGSYISDAILNKNRVKKQPKIYNAVMTYTIVEGLTTSGIFVLYKYEPFYEHIIKDIKEFDRIARHLCRARNPYQHNTDDFLTPDFKEQTKIYCKMIKKKIEEWEKTLSQGNKA